MKLPGQSRHASKRLNDAVAEVQDGLGRNIVFLSLEQFGDPLIRRTVRGYHDSYNGVERIWLDSSLPYTAQEATAAHELAHVMQHKERYPQASSLAGARDQPLIPTLEHLAARTNNLVMDESADLWAARRGFDMGKALVNIGLERLIAGLNHKAVEAEAVDWDGYYTSLKKLAQEVTHARQIKPFTIGAEIDTQVMTLDYAGLSLRLGRYGLFKELDSLWAEHWPVSRKMGKELAAIIRLNGVESREKCRKALEKIIAFLKIPAPLIIIR
ncbi:MAG: ImmA/IrrE family metallo-endopeptidase [Dehalococcoidia bacterium]|nr:MAG: ImmA/IrrE family metallo-endopeptidase [Dehalococcoidia bacterium]